MDWIEIKSEKDLPEEGKYVLAKHSRGTWSDSTDQENVNCVVVKLVKGLSLSDRELMKNGEIENTTEMGWTQAQGWHEYPRSSTHRACDEGGNNQKPYNWEMFGTDSFFGQDISHWMPIPNLETK